MESTARDLAISAGAPDERAAGRLRLSGHVLDLDARELLTADRQLAGLRKQALDVLLLLGARAGQVVTKDELMRAVWRDVVVGDGSLAQAISDIRHVLGEDGHRLVRTVARRGYMLVPDPVAPVAGAAEAQRSLAAPDPHISAASVPPPIEAPAPKRRALRAIAALLVAAAGIGGIAALQQSEPQRGPATGVRAPLAAEVPSVSLVVLPLNGDTAADDWFADAITTDLTVSIGRLARSFVIGRDTAFTYKGKAVDPRDVARELGVRYVVLGSTRRDGDRVRLNLLMVDGETGAQRWSQRFDIERAELESSIDDIVGQLARSLFVEIFHSVGDRVARLQPATIAADDLALRGWSVYSRGLSAENLREALRLFEQALARDPDSVRALAGVTIASNFGAITGWLPEKAAALRRAEETSARLEQFGGDDWFTLGARIIQLNVRGEWENMLWVADAMVERFPNDPVAHHQRSTALMYLGRFEESILPAQRAIRISPRDTRLGIWYWHVANNQFMLGRYDAATESARRMQAASPNFPLATPLLAASMVRGGHKPEAERMLRDYLAVNPSVDASFVIERMRSNHPHFVEGRDRMVASLREIGLR